MFIYVSLGKMGIDIWVATHQIYHVNSNICWAWGELRLLLRSFVHSSKLTKTVKIGQWSGKMLFVVNAMSCLDTCTSPKIVQVMIWRKIAFLSNIVLCILKTHIHIIVKVSFYIFRKILHLGIELQTNIWIFI